jgi:PPOX class probable FMN-dependent enzyme
MLDRIPLASSPPPAVDLDALYAPPAERIQKAVLNHLVDFHAAYLKAATFFCLATSGPQGLDASPRGGPPGFVRMLDAHTIAYADWPGNNRIESLRNLQSDDRVGLLFLFPGLEIFMRINGRARVVTDSDLLTALKEGERVPKTATVVQIDEVLLHCGKAINRAGLWQPEAQLVRDTVPTIGAMMAAFTKMGDPAAQFDADHITQVNAHYAHSVRNDLY